MKELFWEMCSIWSGYDVDFIQEMSKGKEDEMDTEMCSESCQDSDLDGSEFPWCKSGLLVTLFEFLLWLGGMWVMRMLSMLDVFCWSYGCVHLLPGVNFDVVSCV